MRCSAAVISDGYLMFFWCPNLRCRYAYERTIR